MASISPTPLARHRDIEQPATARPQRRSGRAVFLTWLRQIHLYVGLWGAVLGLLFGATGILLNHRSVLKIPVEKTVQRTVQMPLAAQFGNAQDMGRWLASELGYTSDQLVQVKTVPAQVVIWAGREVAQPERWTFILQHPQRGVNAEYYVGNQVVRLDQVDATPIGTLTRLHMGIGATPFWVLLADTIAGSLITLSLTGLLLWTQLRTVRTTAVLTSVGALVAALWYFWAI